MKKYFLSICAIVRNEAPYIAEWIEFHKLQGVQHFYIYHNVDGLEDQETSDALKPYLPNTTAEESLVTAIIWPNKPGQMTAYQNCLDIYGKESEWIVFIDVDEFLWSPEEFEDYGARAITRLTVADQLRTWSDDEDIAIVAPHWVLFGSNNHKEKTDGLVIERFTKRSRDVNPHCKSIVRPEFCTGVGQNPHTFRCLPGKRIVDERGNFLPNEYAVLDGGTTDILRINHYVTKSYQEFIERRKNPTPDTGRMIEDLEEFFREHDQNEETDTRLRDLYADKIKEALNGPRETVE